MTNMKAKDLKYIANLGNKGTGVFNIEACPTSFERNSTLYINEFLKTLKNAFPNYSLQARVSHTDKSSGTVIADDMAIPKNENFPAIPANIEGVLRAFFPEIHKNSDKMVREFHNISLIDGENTMTLSNQQIYVNMESGRDSYGFKDGIHFALVTTKLSKLHNALTDYQRMISLSNVKCGHAQALLYLQTKKKVKVREVDYKPFIGIACEILGPQKIVTREEFSHSTKFKLTGSKEYESYFIGASASLKGRDNPFLHYHM